MSSPRSLTCRRSHSALPPPPSSAASPRLAPSPPLLALPLLCLSLRHRAFHPLRLRILDLRRHGCPPHALPRHGRTSHRRGRAPAWTSDTATPGVAGWARAAAAQQRRHGDQPRRGRPLARRSDAATPGVASWASTATARLRRHQARPSPRGAAADPASTRSATYTDATAPAPIQVRIHSFTHALGVVATFGSIPYVCSLCYCSPL